MKSKYDQTLAIKTHLTDTFGLEIPCTEVTFIVEWPPKRKRTYKNGEVTLTINKAKECTVTRTVTKKINA